MFCRKCGNEIKNGEFCSKCGTKLSQHATDNISNNASEPIKVNNTKEIDTNVDKPVELQVNKNISVENEKNSNACVDTKESGKKIKGTNQAENTEKNSNTIKIIAVSVVALLAILIIAKCMKKTVNLNDYLVADFEGYNNYGTANIYLDIGAINVEFGKKMKYDGVVHGALALEDLVSYNVSQKDELSNGDIITFTWNNPEKMDKKFNYKFKYSDTEFTVEGLKNVETFDPFEGIEISYSGVVPNGCAEINFDNAKYANDLEFKIDKNNGLSNGEIINVNVSIYGQNTQDAFINIFGKIPESITKQYTVDGLGEYITSISQISDSSLDAMKIQADDILKAHVAESNTSNETFVSSDYVGMYALFTKSFDISGDKNAIALVYKLNNDYAIEDSDKSGSYSYYFYVKFDDVQVLPSGENIFDIMNY